MAYARTGDLDSTLASLITIGGATYANRDAIAKYGPEVGDAIVKYGPEVLTLVAKYPQAVPMIRQYGSAAIPIIKQLIAGGQPVTPQTFQAASGSIFGSSTMLLVGAGLIAAVILLRR